ncbi:MAG: DUF2442 domain-containing protein [Imperialibacter sp.]|jgi:hypothetical protein
MSSFNNNYDTLESIIFEGGLRIIGLHFHKELDLMLIVLNNKKVLTRNISGIEKLKNATAEQLANYSLISKGVGVHWPDVDEDLSLKGFLKEELSSVSVPMVS